MNSIAFPGKYDFNNRTLAIATAVGVTIVTGAGIYYMKSRKQKRLEIEKKVEKIVSYINLFKLFLRSSQCNLYL